MWAPRWAVVCPTTLGAERIQEDSPLTSMFQSRHRLLPPQLVRQAIRRLAEIAGLGLWAFAGGYVVFKISDMIFGIRITPKEELEGLDLSEHGTTSYPEFGSTVSAKPGQRLMPDTSAS